MARDIESPPLKRQIRKGPVLGLDIDGVCSVVPFHRFGEKSADYPGWPVIRGLPADSPLNRTGMDLHLMGEASWNQHLPEWFDRLAAAYRQVVWTTSWSRGAAEFAAAAGSKVGMQWPHVGRGKYVDDGDGYGGEPWVRPDVPLALVDDHYDGHLEWGRGDERAERLIATRTAPTLMVAPAKDIGLFEALVDLLVEFAENPHSPRFAVAKQGAVRFGWDREGLKWTGQTRNPDGWPTPMGGLRPVDSDGDRAQLYAESRRRRGLPPRPASPASP